MNVKSSSSIPLGATQVITPKSLGRHSASPRTAQSVRRAWRVAAQTASAPRARSELRRPNLLILGASGHVAQAFLQRLSRWRAELGGLVLLDQNDRVVRDPHLPHERLDYVFVHHVLHFPEDTVRYQDLLRRHAVDVVLDVTDLDTLPVWAATDALGVSYINTGLNDAARNMATLWTSMQALAARPTRAPHLLSSGMNPGIVNLWVWHAYRHYGPPREIVHFEYDDSEPADGWRPLITWSPKEFLAETVWEPTGRVVAGVVQPYPTNALQQQESLRPVLAPVLRRAAYPRGFLILHEENIALGQRLGVSSKYLYSIHPRTRAWLEQRWRECGRIEVADLEVGDNTTVPLIGADTIGVCLEYPQWRIYYLHSLANVAVRGANATCAQVAVGIEAALTVWLRERLAPRIYFAHDLYDTCYREVIFRELPVEHRMLEQVNGQWVMRHRWGPLPAHSLPVRQPEWRETVWSPTRAPQLTVAAGA